MPARHESVPDAIPSGMVSGANNALCALRAALVRGDVDTAQSLRWLAPRPPGERDLFSDMAAAEGLRHAVTQLGRFWNGADLVLERVRAVSPVEAELYERLVHRGESLPIVSVVRRDDPEAPWKVVCTNEARDERFRLWVSVRAESIDDIAWSRRPGVPGQLLMDDERGVLGHPEAPWLVHVNGPFVPLTIPDALPARGRVVELAIALASRGEDRAPQLCWLLEAAYHLLDQCGGDAAYVPDDHRLLLPDALYAAARDQMLPRQTFGFWVRTRQLEDHVVTEGLGRLGLPELEAPIGVLSRPELTRSVLERFGATLIASPHLPTLGTELLVGSECVVVVAGRRGPKRGTSYGRFGAFALAPWDPAQRGSRTRLRIPVD